MRVKIRYRSSKSLEYEFELEGADWETILRDEKHQGEEFDKANRKIWPRKRFLDRWLGREPDE